MPARRFPSVNVALIAANFIVSIFAHVGGFAFGLIAARLLATSGVAGSARHAGALAEAGATR
jgi:membrane associated rhomboid family serine protease